MSPKLLQSEYLDVPKLVHDRSKMSPCVLYRPINAKKYQTPFFYMLMVPLWLYLDESLSIPILVPLVF